MNETHFILCQDFFPKIGGAHLWLYEVYKRWPNKVYSIVNDYSKDDILEKEQKIFDNREHNNLEIIRQNLNMKSYNMLSWSFWLICFRVIKIISRFSNKEGVCIHALRAFPEGFIALFYKIIYPQNTKLITYVHGEEVLIAQSSRQFKNQAKLVYKFSDLIISNSISTKNIVNKYYPKTKIVVINPGVDYRMYQIEKFKIFSKRKQWKAKTNDIILFCIARMEKRKNHQRIIRAVSNLYKKGISIRCIFAGDGEELGHLKQLVVKYGLENLVQFLGRISEVEKMNSLAACDIFIMPSIECGDTVEGFGIVFLEAAAAGKPSIAGKIGGQSEAVKHGTTGLVIDGTNINDIENAIMKLVNNPDLRRKMGREGQKWAMLNDWELVSLKIYRNVQQVLKR